MRVRPLAWRCVVVDALAVAARCASLALVFRDSRNVDDIAPVAICGVRRLPGGWPRRVVGRVNVMRGQYSALSFVSGGSSGAPACDEAPCAHHFIVACGLASGRCDAEVACAALAPTRFRAMVGYLSGTVLDVGKFQID